MSEPEHHPTMGREELLALVAELQHQIAALTASHAAWFLPKGRKVTPEYRIQSYVTF